MSLPRHPSRPWSPSPATGQRLLRAVALASAVATASLIGIGGVVRATGSGLGCPGWPKCFGRWIPPLEYHAVIEYAHRLAASVVIVLIGVLAVVAVARYRSVRRVVVPAVAAFVLVFVQAGVGAVVVHGELEPLLVTVHFATAMLLLGVLAYAVVASNSLSSSPVDPAHPLTRLARWSTGATFAVLAVGAYVRGEGAGLAFTGWPLMDGALVPDLSTVPSALHFAHRVLAAGAVLLAVAVAGLAWRERQTLRWAAVLAVITAGLYLIQALVGAANVWTRLAPAAVAVHVTLAGVVFGFAVATAAASSLRPGREAAPELALDGLGTVAVRRGSLAVGGATRTAEETGRGGT